MASSETTGNMFTEYFSDIINSEDQNKRIQMTRSYLNSGFASVHPAIWCMGSHYRNSMCGSERLLIINAAFTEHGVPKDSYDAITWLNENPDIIKYFYYRGLV